MQTIRSWRPQKRHLPRPLSHESSSGRQAPHRSVGFFSGAGEGFPHPLAALATTNPTVTSKVETPPLGMDRVLELVDTDAALTWTYLAYGTLCNPGYFLPGHILLSHLTF